MTITVKDASGVNQTIQTADDIVTALGSVATQTTAAAILAKLSSDPATQTTLAAVLAALQGTLTVGLPSGAATSAKQDTLNTTLGTLATQTTLAAVLSALQGTLAVSAASLPLPSGAATSANQSTGNTSLASILSALQGTLSVNLAQRLDAANDNITVAKWGTTANQVDEEFTILASGARTATTTVDIVKPKMARGLVMWVQTSSGADATNTITVSLVGRDATTTNGLKTIVAFNVINSNTTVIYQIYPAASLAGSYTQSTPIVLPQNVRVNVAHGSTGSVTYAIGGCWVS